MARPPIGWKKSVTNNTPLELHPLKLRTRTLENSGLEVSATTKLHRLKENIGGASVDLPPADLAEIGTAAASIKIEGTHYPKKLEQMTAL